MKLTASSSIGWAALIAGGLVMSGWLLHEPAIVRAVAGALMVFNTAFCFFLSGLALAAESVLSVPNARLARAVLGSAVALLGTLVFAEYLAGGDFGVDLRPLHVWLIDSNPHPGRMSPPTSFAFFVTGATLAIMDRVRGLWAGLAVQVLTALVFLLGAIGVAGRILRLELVYPNYLFGQMALATGSAFVAISAALWLCWRRADWYRSRQLIRREEERIALNAAVVLALIVSVSAVTGFAVLSRHLEESARRGLLEPLKTLTELFEVNLDLRSTRAAVISTRPFVIELLARAYTRADDRDAMDRLQLEAETLVPFGFSGVAFYDTHGERRAAAGSFVDAPQLALPLDLGRPATLVWDSEFVLHNRTMVWRDDRPVGAVVAQQHLPALTAALKAAEDFAESGEVVVCAREGEEFACVRQRPPPPVFRVPYSPALPIARAFEGRTGVSVDRDYRGRYVIAAHGPIGSTGLAMVIKMDTEELYAPVRALLQSMLVLLALAVTGGAWLLRLRIVPIVRQLSLSEERLTLALEGSRLALWDMDARSGAVWLDARWPEMLGGNPAPIVTTARDLQQLVHPDDLPALRQHVGEVLDGRAAHYDMEHRVRKRSGEWLWIRSRGRVFARDAQGRALRLAGTNADIDERKHIELRLAHQAGHDALTGLPNRTLFHDRTLRAIARSRRNHALMALLYLDIDRFKSVNDTHGHDAGDALIREFSRRLAACIRDVDTAARLGGDEFAVILEGLDDPQDGCKLAEKIVAAMREEFLLGGKRLPVSTSVGVAFYRGEDGVEPEAILKRADEALYAAKAAGRNTYRVSASVA